MSEVEQEPQVEEPEQQDDAEEPDEDDAEAAATAEREQELAADRQEEAQSIEAQAREQDAKAKKLNQVAAHTAKRYYDILGEGLDGFVMCPLCAPWFPGIRQNVMPDYETVAAVKVAIGEDPDPPLTNDHYSKVCEDCGGLGKVLTGSKVMGQTTAQCIPCKGRGWLAIGPEREQGSLTQGGLTAEPSAVQAAAANGDKSPEQVALESLGAIVVWPIATPEAIAAQGG